MARVPVIGRLFWFEYLALFGSLLLVLLEWIIHIITFCLPEPIIDFCYERSKTVFNLAIAPEKPEKQGSEKRIANAVAHASDFTEICAIFGYEAEEHIVHTQDGYLLGLHRLPYRKGEEGRPVNQGEGSVKKKVVYLHHGLMMCSEVWICLTEEERCLPFQLVERGYDVWLGNNRGNKYSKKSTRCSPLSNEFWDFSIDQFAFHDIPDSINYILELTCQPSLSYIGFSQGTAQAFATLSIHPQLNRKIDVFVALAPAMAPARISNPVVDSLMKASPNFIFLLFGRRSILSSTTMWQTILYPPIFMRIIDTSLSFLFNWKCKNISRSQKLAGYLHLFSFTSTKSVVHWFQIIRNRNFQFYDDEIYAPFSIVASERFYKPVKYPTRNIKTPIVLLYGGSDSLVDIDVMQKELPRGTTAKIIPKYEHLDFLWASDVPELVFGHVFEALDRYGSTKGLADGKANGVVKGTERRVAA
ncbi:Alpha/Beta hydrolase protein [Aspergillus keveii]|uniref:Alpha/Beta hydrolase protein n=1 Tax=Aspergillus keveii TaxID=714993 RepID=A0ABR4GRF2_9EURO